MKKKYPLRARGGAQAVNFFCEGRLLGIDHPDVTIDNPDVTLPEKDREVRLPDPDVTADIPAATRSYRDVLVNS
jgi:hypothetical protein